MYQNDTAHAATGATNGHPTTLFPAHLADLRRSGLTDETIAAAGIRSEHDREKLARLLNRRSWSQLLGSAMVIPYFDSDGSVVLNRVKPDRPANRNGKSAKYLSPTGASVRVYFPPGTHRRIDDGAVDILITEGEKKALAASQAGFCCIALSGVDCWHGKKSTALIPDLNFEWAGRVAVLVFDSDAATNANVRQNECLLAAALERGGAKAKVVRLPSGDDGAKVGLDDFIVSSGPGALRRLIDTAAEPEQLPPELVRTDAKDADPADIATKFLTSSSTDGVYRLRFWRSTFWYYDNGGYRELSDDDVLAKIVEFLCRDHFLVKRDHAGNVLLHVKSQSLVPSHVDAPAWLAPKSSDDWVPLECIATKNRIINLRRYADEKEYSQSSTPQFFTTASCGYDFDELADQPLLWHAFLKSLWGDDSQSISLLREFFGYCLTPDTRQQKLLMIVGPKRSGKGTILRILRALVGPMNVAAPTLSSLCGRFGLWPLIGKSVAIISDARLSGRSDQAVIVERILSVTGEDAQTVDRKNLQPVTVQLPTRFVIVSNELPRLGDASGALVSRMLLLHTVNSFYGQEDHSLTKKLLAELPGILLWAISGWQSLRERGHFVQPKSSQELLDELIDLSSPIGAFVREKCDVDPEATVPVDLLYSHWQVWCEVNGKTYCTDKATFGRDLFALLPHVRRIRPTSENGKRVYEYGGIELKFEALPS